jgi:chromosome segregation ATPase
MVRTQMSETEVLNGLQIKRRELENELASLSQTEKYLKNDLKALEEKIIGQLEKEIKAKKLALNGLESRKGELEKKLSDLQGNPVNSQTAERANGETAEPAQQKSNEENDTELTVVECQPEAETVENRREEAKHNLVF